jgi:hypothetical protein
MESQTLPIPIPSDDVFALASQDSFDPTRNEIETAAFEAARDQVKAYKAAQALKEAFKKDTNPS